MRLPSESVWAMGARTVAQAERESGQSRQKLFALMADGTLAWFAEGGRGTRVIAWASLVAWLDSQHAEHLRQNPTATTGAGARTR